MVWGLGVMVGIGLGIGMGQGTDMDLALELGWNGNDESHPYNWGSMKYRCQFWSLELEIILESVIVVRWNKAMLTSGKTTAMLNETCVTAISIKDRCYMVSSCWWTSRVTHCTWFQVIGIYRRSRNHMKGQTW